MTTPVKKLVVVVDMQYDFLDHEEGSLNLGHCTKDLCQRVAAYVKDALEEGIPVFLTKDTHEEDAAEFISQDFPKHCVKGTRGHDIILGLTELFPPPLRKPHHVIEKNSFGSHLVAKEIYTRYKPETIVVMGVCTHICVHAITANLVDVAKNLFDYAPKIEINTQLVDDFDPEMATAMLTHLERVYKVQVS